MPEKSHANREFDVRPTNGSSQRWDTTTKRIVALVVLVFLALLIYQFRDLLIPLGMALLLAFILNPIVDFLQEHTHLPRGIVTALIFLVLIMALLGVLAAPVTAVPSIRRAIRSVQLDLNRIISDIGAFFERPVEIWEYELDLSGVYQELSEALRSFVRRAMEGTLDVVLGIASGAFWLFFILIVSFYLVRDAHRIIEHIDQLAPAGYHDDVVHLRQQITEVWNAFLRGQLVLGSAMAIVTAVMCTTIGLPYGWALGLLAGFMEFVPNIGPFIAAIPAVLLALLKGSSFLPLGNLPFALLVAGLYTVLQQIENNFFVPRILGRSLNLHPLAVLIAILAGGSLRGILGMLLAAPTLATFRVLGRYVLHRLYDRDPFAKLTAEEEDEAKEPEPSLIRQASKAALDQLQERMKQTVKQYVEHSESKQARGKEIVHGGRLRPDTEKE